MVYHRPSMRALRACARAKGKEEEAPKARKRKGEDKLFEASVTISVCGADIDPECLRVMERFMEERCVSGICALERGGALAHLHLQMVCRLHISSLKTLNEMIKKRPGWDDPKVTSRGHLVMTKSLRNKGIHTYVGMIGYCMKDLDEPHFNVVYCNVSPAELEEGMSEYIKYGAASVKNRVCLTHQNLLDRAATYCRFKMRKQLGSSLPGAILAMLRSGQFYPAAGWVVLARNIGMDFRRSQSLWRCMMLPDRVELEDVLAIFFEYETPGSRLRELERDQLAVELNEVRTGAAHEYTRAAGPSEGGALPSPPTVAGAPPTVVKASGAPEEAPKARKRKGEDKVFEASVTISVCSADIDPECLRVMERFMEERCVSGICALERGGALAHLHLQMVCRLHVSSLKTLNEMIKKRPGWDDPKVAPRGHLVMTKSLRNKGLHTYVGMIGYCMKDLDEPHFNVVYCNVSPAELEEGMSEYIKYGAASVKNRVCLTHQNLLERAATYCRFKMRKQLGSSLPGAILAMLRSGQFYPAAGWVVPARNSGMDFRRSQSLWRCMMLPDRVELEDVLAIFFEYETPGSRLRELERDRLAVELDEVRTGAAHEYTRAAGPSEGGALPSPPTVTGAPPAVVNVESYIAIRPGGGASGYAF